MVFSSVSASSCLALSATSDLAQSSVSLMLGDLRRSMSRSFCTSSTAWLRQLGVEFRHFEAHDSQLLLHCWDSR